MRLDTPSEIPRWVYELLVAVVMGGLGAVVQAVAARPATSPSPTPADPRSPPAMSPLGDWVEGPSHKNQSSYYTNLKKT